MEIFKKSKPSSMLRTVTRRFLYVFIPLLILLGLGKFEFIAKEVYEAGILLAASIVFILGIPLSLILDIDSMQNNLGVESNELCLFIASAVAYLNFVGYGIFFSFLKKKEKKEKKND